MTQDERDPDTREHDDEWSPVVPTPEELDTGSRTARARPQKRQRDSDGRSRVLRPIHRIITAIRPEAALNRTEVRPPRRFHTETDPKDTDAPTTIPTDVEEVAPVVDRTSMESTTAGAPCHPDAGREQPGPSVDKDRSDGTGTDDPPPLTTISIPDDVQPIGTVSTDPAHGFTTPAQRYRAEAERLGHEFGEWTMSADGLREGARCRRCGKYAGVLYETVRRSNELVPCKDGDALRVHCSGA